MGWLRRILGSRSRDAGGPPHAGGTTGPRAEWIEMPALSVGGSMWAGELWANQPIWAPRHVDVGDFLRRRPLPYLWPDDPEYRAFVDEVSDPAEWLLVSWLFVFLHHPDPAVVVDALRQPTLGGSTIHCVMVADLTMLHPDPGVRDAAAHATWNLDDDQVRQVVHVLDDDADLPPQVQAPYAPGAVDRVAAAAPTARTDLAAELRRR